MGVQKVPERSAILVAGAVDVNVWLGRVRRRATEPGNDLLFVAED